MELSYKGCSQSCSWSFWNLWGWTLPQLPLLLILGASAGAASPLWKLKGIPCFPLPNGVKHNPCQAPQSGWEKGFRRSSSVACSVLTTLKKKKIRFYFRGSQEETPSERAVTSPGTCGTRAELFTLGTPITHGVSVPASVGSFCLDRRGDKVAGSYYPHALPTRTEGILQGPAISYSVFNYEITNELSIPTSRICITPKRAGVVWNRGTRDWRFYRFNPWVYI